MCSKVTRFSSTFNTIDDDILLIGYVTVMVSQR